MSHAGNPRPCRKLAAVLAESEAFRSEQKPSA